MPNNHISVIIVNYCSAADTIACVESLLAQESKLNKIIIVDNNSPDNSVELLINHFSDNCNCQVEYDFLENETVSEGYKLSVSGYDLYVLCSRVNGGYAYGNNLGIRFSLNNFEDKIFLISNADIIYSTDSLIKLYDDYISSKTLNPRVGFMGAKLNYYHDPEIVQAYGGSYDPIFGRCKHIGAHYKEDDIKIDSLKMNVDYPIGACLLLDRETFTKTGGLSEDYFLYYEELDFVKKCSRYNIEFDISTSSLILHKEGGSIGSSSHSLRDVSVISDKFILRSRLKFTKKYYKRYLLSVLFVHFYHVFLRLKIRDKKKFLNSLKAIYILFK